jgi:hypothetical protein
VGLATLPYRPLYRAATSYSWLHRGCSHPIHSLIPQAATNLRLHQEHVWAKVGSILVALGVHNFFQWLAAKVK